MALPCRQFPVGQVPSRGAAWRPRTHLVREGFEAFAFDSIVDGAHVPVVAWMQRAGKDVERASVPTRDPRQLPLF
ncbi:hypothetical protein GD429_16255 [Burkholderia sp. BE17]|nr:hypothetical protein [Burkholderia sp. BE17]